jgi:hypothetical protein
MAKNSSFDALFDSLADRITDKVLAALGPALKSGKVPAGRKSTRSGKKLDMNCRVAGCKNKSRGPRFGFICDDHRKKLGKAEQQAARDAWNAKKK